MLSKKSLIKSLGLNRALSSKTKPVSAAAAPREGLRLDQEDHESIHQRQQMFGINTVRVNPSLIEPKFKTFSYTMAKSYDTHLLCDTVGERLNALASEKPNDIGYKFCLTQTSLSFGEMKQRVDEMAQNFLELGFKKGSNLLLLLLSLFLLE